MSDNKTVEVDLDIPCPVCWKPGARIVSGEIEECFTCWAKQPDPRIVGLKAEVAFHRERANKLERLYDDMATARSKAQCGKIAAQSRVIDLESEVESLRAKLSEAHKNRVAECGACAIHALIEDGSRLEEESRE